MGVVMGEVRVGERGRVMVGVARGGGGRVQACDALLWAAHQIPPSSFASTWLANQEPALAHAAHPST